MWTPVSSCVCLAHPSTPTSNLTRLSKWKGSAHHLHTKLDFAVCMRAVWMCKIVFGHRLMRLGWDIHDKKLKKKKNYTRKLPLICIAHVCYKQWSTRSYASVHLKLQNLHTQVTFLVWPFGVRDGSTAHLVSHGLYSIHACYLCRLIYSNIMACLSCQYLSWSTVRLFMYDSVLELAKLKKGHIFCEFFSLLLSTFSVLLHHSVLLSVLAVLFTDHMLQIS